MRFTVITICFNDPDGLHATLKSVARQTSQDYEYIVVDGGSSIETPKLLEDADELVDFWVSEVDEGIYDAMNKGVALASGDYVIFMNAGDEFFDENVLSAAGKVIEDMSPPLFFGQAYGLNPNAQEITYHQELWQGMICSHQATFSRRDLHEKYPFSTDHNIVSDYLFYVQCETGGTPIQRIELDVARVDTSGLSYASFEARTLERLKICQHYYPRSEVYSHFETILASRGLDMPAWAATEEIWLSGAD